MYLAGLSEPHSHILPYNIVVSIQWIYRTGSTLDIPIHMVWSEENWPIWLQLTLYQHAVCWYKVRRIDQFDFGWPICCKFLQQIDTQVYIENRKVETDLHVKPTSWHQYLHTKSCHPKHSKTAIPYSQALRIKRICSERETSLYK